MSSLSPIPPWFARLAPPDRPSFRPLPALLRGKPSAIVSDGCAFTVLAGVGAKKPADDYERDVAASLGAVSRRCPPDRQEVSWATIRRFLDGVSVRAKERAPGFVAPGVAINRQLLKRFLGPLKSDRVVVRTGGEFDPVHFVGAGWLVVVMPLRLDPGGRRPRSLVRGVGSVPFGARARSSGALGTPHRATPPASGRDLSDRAVRKKLSKARSAGQIGRRA